MTTALHRPRHGLVHALLLPVLAVLGVSACHRDIGDDCQTSIDCDPNGARVCDLSQPGGYCTIPGCTEKSCPSEAVCIRYFPEKYLTKPCNPACEDRACQLGACADPSSCLPPCGDACPTGLTDDCGSSEICIDSGLCAQASFEQRACAKSCGGNDDCRGGYECRTAGTRGSILLSPSPTATARFCAPRV